MAQAYRCITPFTCEQCEDVEVEAKEVYYMEHGQKICELCYEENHEYDNE